MKKTFKTCTHIGCPCHDGGDCESAKKVMGEVTIGDLRKCAEEANKEQKKLYDAHECKEDLNGYCFFCGKNMLGLSTTSTSAKDCTLDQKNLGNNYAPVETCPICQGDCGGHTVGCTSKQAVAKQKVEELISDIMVGKIGANVELITKLQALKYEI